MKGIDTCTQTTAVSITANSCIDVTHLTQYLCFFSFDSVLACLCFVAVISVSSHIDIFTIVLGHNLVSYFPVFFAWNYKNRERREK